MLTKKFVCPTEAFDCPYWKNDGSCKLADERENPVWECDDAMSFWNETEYEDDSEWFIWEDENGNRYTTQEILEQGYHIVNDEPTFEPGRPIINMFELNP